MIPVLNSVRLPSVLLCLTLFFTSRMQAGAAIFSTPATQSHR